MGNYYCLISGLPDLQLDEQKIKLSLSDFKTELEENLSVADLQLINYFFMKYDNENLLRLLKSSDFEFEHNLGSLSKEQLLDIISVFKETDEPTGISVYGYLKYFLPAYLSNKPIVSNMDWVDQLTSVYYDYAVQCKNKFISSWFQYNLTITNLLTAVNCLRYHIDRETAIVGTGEVAELIRTSNSRDFGIAPIFPDVEEILKVAENPNIYEREKSIDALRWKWLEENGFFHYFDIEHLFIYLLKVDMLQRWLKLEKETGLGVFREMIGQLQKSFEFPVEFAVKKVK